MKKTGFPVKGIIIAVLIILPVGWGACRIMEWQLDSGFQTAYARTDISVPKANSALTIQYYCTTNWWVTISGTPGERDVADSVHMYLTSADKPISIFYRVMGDTVVLYTSAPCRVPREFPSKIVVRTVPIVGLMYEELRNGVRNGAVREISYPKEEGPAGS